MGAGPTRSIVAGIPPDVATLAHEGGVAYRDKYELVWRQRAERPNAVWQADHTELDILIRDANGGTARPWLTVVEDDHSRAVCGYMTFLGAPSAMNTALALRQAIWPKPVAGWPVCGIPDRLYVDHGSDFTSHQLHQIGHDLHFEIIFSTIARPQGRGKSSGSSAPSTPSCCPVCPGTSRRGSATPFPRSPWTSSTPPSGASSPRPTSRAPTPSCASARSPPGSATDGCRGSRRPSRS